MSLITLHSKPLGTPLPDSVHAVSVSLPLWADIVGYEEREPRVMEKLKTAYPRFCYHPYVKQLCAHYEETFAGEKEFCLVFPSEVIAKECVAYVKNKQSIQGRVNAVKNSLYAVTFPKNAADCAKDFWQHVGLNISSRLAEYVLQGTDFPDASKEKQIIRERLAGLTGFHADDVYLYPSGMAAVYSIHQAVRALAPHKKTIQLGFPYVDSLKVQEKCGAGVHFINYLEETDLAKVETLLEQENIAAVFCEIPSNPLLNTIDLKALSALLRRYDVPLIVDNTIATWENIDLRPYADAVVTSLTKFFSGVGDVLAGALTLNQASPFYHALKSAVDAGFEDVLFAEDASVLEKNSRDCQERMKIINRNAEALCDVLVEHPAVKTVYYPKYINRLTYEALKKPKGGYGGLFSVVLKEQKSAPIFYDRLQVAKGPSLGTNFTLACPYTLLAHYHELDFVEFCGVAADLVRVSVGLEDSEELISLFAEALKGL